MKVSQETKKELSGFMKKSLNGLSKAVADATDVAKKELPEVAKEIIRYNGIVKNLISLGTSALILIAISVGTYFLHVAYPTDWGYFVGAGVGGLICAACVCDAVQNIVKAKTAPRLYLIEYVKDLLTERTEEKKS